ncbi:MAG: AMP-binding protein [Acidobacteria bacterium]|nr:AMP-binding protein [Acidobacteriota bacterium]
MQLQEFLETSSRHYPDKTALVAGGRRLTYAEINQQANRLANALTGEGISRWDRVVICLQNSAEAVVSIFGTLKAGAVFVPVNPTTKPDKLAYILQNSGARALITHDSIFGGIKSYPWRDSLACVFLDIAAGNSMPQREGRVSYLSEVLRDDTLSAPPASGGIDMDLAALVYTSGSTGGPKGVMLTHLNMVSAATSITTYLENTADDIILNVLPLSFDYGLYQVLMALKLGATVILERTFTYPAAVLDRIAREKVTGLPIVPTISAMLLQMELAKWDLSSVRYITNTGAALPLDHILKLRKLFPRAKIYSMYGLTECKRVSYLPPDQIDIRPTSVGKGMPNEEVYIVDEHGDRVGPGVVGELVIRGSNVMKGYWNMPEETDKVLKPGLFPWERVLYSGDLFRSDEEGYLYWVGRRDDIIKSRGQKVSPREIEDVLYSLPGVAEAAVVGIPDQILGSAIKAFIVPQQGVRLAEEDVLRHCSQHLEDFMLPGSVEFRDQMPKTSTGKIAKRELCTLPEAS